MTGIETELAIYDEIHRNPLNRMIHAIGIPVIMFSVLGLAALASFGDGRLRLVLNGGTVLAVVAPARAGSQARAHV